MNNIKIKKYVAAPFKLVLLALGIAVFFCLKILRPLVFVRIGVWSYARLGEIATFAELYLRQRASQGIARGEVHIFLSGEPANEQLFKMIKRKIRIFKVNNYLMWLVNYMRKLFGNSKFWLSSGYNEIILFREFYLGFNSSPPQLEFTAQEEQKGKQLLHDLGIGPQDQFVCLHVRDKAYLDKVHPYFSREEWRYHDYRDAEIDTYIPAVDYLTSLGIFVIRMGYIVEKKFKIDNPYVIDYATHHRSDFADIYLSAKCTFFLGSEGGLICVPWAFNVPVAYSNRIPPTMGGRHDSNIYIPKKLWWKKEKRFMTFQEIYSYGANHWFQGEEYEKHGLEVVNNTPQEIFELVKEMNLRLEGKWVTTQEEKELQSRYLNILPEEFKCTLALPKIGTEFLRMNQDLLEIKNNAGENFIHSEVLKNEKI